jgi:hypothetical protein
MADATTTAIDLTTKRKARPPLDNINGAVRTRKEASRTSETGTWMKAKAVRKTQRTYRSTQHAGPDIQARVS